LSAAAEQEKLMSEITTIMASLGDLDTEAAEVMGKQQTLQDKQAEQEQVLQEVSERREKQQKEVGAGRPRG
jgi:predicted  nucleic acid-binding Zn-ribbon protein